MNSLDTQKLAVYFDRRVLRLSAADAVRSAAIGWIFASRSVPETGQAQVASGASNAALRTRVGERSQVDQRAAAALADGE